MNCADLTYIQKGLEIQDSVHSEGKSLEVALRKLTTNWQGLDWGEAGEAHLAVQSRLRRGA